MQNKIKVRYPKTFDDVDEYNYIKNLNPDLVVVVAYGKILPKKILEIKKGSFINIHASLLPKWRGAAPIHRSIMNLDKETGVSIMQITPKLDSGPILMKSKVKIKSDTNFENLSKELAKLGSSIILKSLELIESREAKYEEQDESKVSYAKKIKKAEAKIQWKNDAKKIIAQINALYPNPGSWFEYNGSRLKIIKAKEVEKRGNVGEILSDRFIIGCQKNAIQILELQKEGKTKISIEEYLNGHSLKVGDLVG